MFPSSLSSIQALKGFAPDIMSTLMDILRSDNEENAAVALKVIVDLHKNYKALVEDFVQPFFDFVKEAYKSMEQAVEEAFSPDSEAEGERNGYEVRLSPTWYVCQISNADTTDPTGWTRE